MKTTIVLLLLYSAVYFVVAEEAATKDLEVATREHQTDVEEGDDLGRKHKKKRKKHQQSSSPCGYGRTFLGDKFFGRPDYTYVNAPVMNYFFGCGGPVVPQYAPVQPIPVFQISQHQGHGHGGHGHGGHGHGHGHGGHGGHGGHSDHGGHGGQGFSPFGYNTPYQQQGYQQPYQQGYQSGYSGYSQRPFQSAVSAAASGFGTALADYFTRPRKAQRQINQLLRPIYKLV